MSEEARNFTAKERKAAAAKGQAMKDGSFPILNAATLKAAIKLVGNAKDPVAAKAHVIKRARALGLTKLLPKGWGSKDKAMRDDALLEHIMEAARLQAGSDLAGTGYLKTPVTCVARNCGRQFIGMEALHDHAEAVHTFNDIRQLLAEALREKYNVASTGTSPGTYTWIEDLAVDWVVFTVERPTESDLYKASYLIDGQNNVTLGEAVPVVRRTVYEEVAKD
jgi:hypothetical protein